MKIAYTKILGYFSDEVFYNLDELNETIADRLADINSAMTRADGTTRRMRFEQEEAPVMRDLPPTPFTEVDGRFFSVPVGRYRVPGCWWLPVPVFYPRLRLSGLT